MKTPSPPPRGKDRPDTVVLLESSRSLRLLVKEAALRLKQARDESQAQRVLRGFDKGNGQRFHSSRY